MSAVSWTLAEFDSLTPHDVHDLLKLRFDVFIVEQACAFAEIDGRDPACLHLIGRIGPTAVACARLVPPGLIGPEPRIGRVVTAKSVRGAGLGKELMHRAIQELEARYPGQAIRVEAQADYVGFYQHLGFSIHSPTYLEDGIPHLSMIRSSTTSEGD